MGKYLFYTGIILLVFGVIGAVFIWFYFNIKKCLVEWRFIKKNEMGKAVKENLVTKKRSKKEENNISEIQGVTSSYTLETLNTEIDGQKSDKNPVVEISYKTLESGKVESVRFGEDLIQASFTEILDDDDEIEIEQKDRTDKETGVLLDEMTDNKETSVLEEEEAVILEDLRRLTRSTGIETAVLVSTDVEEIDFETGVLG